MINLWGFALVLLLNNAKKNSAKLFVLILLLGFLNISKAQEVDYDDIRSQGIALYATQNYKEAQKLFESIPSNKKDETIYLLLANIAQENSQDNVAISNLNKSLDKNFEFYKAYYNLGCIFASKKSNLLALSNFELAIKYNKNFAPAYYNLARCQMELRDYKSAKKNLIKALELEPTKDVYYNLAFCYKELGNTKHAQKLLDIYNKMD